MVMQPKSSSKYLYLLCLASWGQPGTLFVEQTFDDESKAEAARLDYDRATFVIRYPRELAPVEGDRLDVRELELAGLF